jgi:hypothetical protein
VTGPACPWCRRVVRLRGVSPQGRICSNCCAKRRTGTCACCGRVARLVGRSPAGSAWCERCARRAASLARVAGHRAVVVGAVAAVEPDLDAAVIDRVVTAVATSRRALRRLAEQLTAHPQALLEGPTSTVPVLDRLAGALAEAGATRVRQRHPECVGCGQARPPHKRVDGGGLCHSCYSLIRRRCDGCGDVRRAYARDGDGKPLCEVCVRRRRQQRHDAQVTAGIGTVLHRGPAGGIPSGRLATIVTCVAPRPCDRRALADHLATLTSDGSDLVGDLGDSGRAGEVGEVAALGLAARRLILALARAGVRGLPQLACRTCGRPVGPDGHAALNGDQCGNCSRYCPGCGRSRRGPGQRQCTRCCRDLRRGARRGQCQTCGRVDRILDGQGRCWFCRQRAACRCDDCAGPALPRRRLNGRGLCDRCASRHRLDDVLPPTTSPPLQRLRQAILAADPSATRQWLVRARTRSILTALHHGDLDATHAALDALPGGRDLDHLRDLLVASGVLPQEPTRRIDQLAEELLAHLHGLPDADRHAVHAWIRWRVLARLRRTADTGRNLAGSIATARATTVQVLAFLVTLHRQGRQLATCRQDDVDTWFAAPAATAAHVRSFLAWARRHRHLPAGLRLPPSRQGAAQPPADPEYRWAIARRLVHDDTLDPADRVAGALVVLYAQPITRIVTLTTGHVHTQGPTVTVALGPDRLELPEPFATLIRELPRHRRDGPPAHLPNPWLFPSARAGKHTTPGALSRRLHTLGIDPRAMRHAALVQLAAEIPPAMLAGTLGIHVQTAVNWTRVAGGNWTTYAAMRRQ